MFSNNKSNFVQLLRQQFKHFGDECQLPSRFKVSVQNIHKLQQHIIEVIQNGRIVLSMNSCGKSFHIDSKAVFSSTMLVSYGVYF